MIAILVAACLLPQGQGQLSKVTHQQFIQMLIAFGYEFDDQNNPDAWTTGHGRLARGGSDIPF